MMNFYKKMRLFNKIMLGLIITSVLVVSTTLFLFVSVRNTEVFSQNANEKYFDIIKTNNRIQSIVIQQQALALEFVAAGNDQSRNELIEKFRFNDRSFKQEFGQLQTLLASEQGTLLADLQRKHEGFSYVVNNLFTQYVRGNTAVVDQIIPNATASAEQVVAAVSGLSADILDLVKTLQAQNNNKVMSMTIFSVALMISGLLVAIVVTYFVAMGIKKPIAKLVGVTNKLAGGDLRQRVDSDSQDEIGQMAQAFNAMVGQLAGLIRETIQKGESLLAFSGNIAQSAVHSEKIFSEINAAFENTANEAQRNMDNVRQMNAIIGENTLNIRQIAASTERITEVARESSLKAEEGGEKLQSAIGKMEEMQHNSEEANQIVQELKALFQEVAQITTVTAQFATATNVLAFNAEIEAARTGEHGRGFAVIAAEIRKLAMASAENNKKVSERIENMLSFSENAIAVLSKGHASIANARDIINTMAGDLQEIISNTQRQANEIQEVYSTIEELTASSEMMDHQANQLEKFTENTVHQTIQVSAGVAGQAENIKDLKSQAQALTVLAQELHKSVERFSI
jgi:methyl-accepting chemotaxis protein